MAGNGHESKRGRVHTVQNLDFTGLYVESRGTAMTRSKVVHRHAPAAPAPVQPQHVWWYLIACAIVLLLLMHAGPVHAQDGIRQEVSSTPLTQRFDFLSRVLLP